MNVKVSTLGIVGLAVLSAAGLRAAVLLPDEIVAPEGVSVRIAESGVVSVRADGVPVEEVRLFWRRPLSEGTRVFRDDWERTYAEAGWTTVRDNLGSAWYTMIHEDGRTDGYGVEVQPNALAWWTTATNGVTLTLNLRAGGAPLRLGARTLEAVRLVTRRGAAGESAFAAGRAFCRMMCPVSRLAKEPVYGYNDWYCAYGKNTATNFLSDAGFIVGLCEGLENRPYVVMDDGWQRNSPPVVEPLNLGSSGWGPWDEAGEGFGMRMRPFAAAVAALGAKPGLWYRPFRAWEEIPDDMRLGAILYTVRNGLLDDASVGVPYCEKYIFMHNSQRLIDHYHVFKTEDIINRAGGGVLQVFLWNVDPKTGTKLDTDVHVFMDGVEHVFKPGERIRVRRGESITLTPYLTHIFGPEPGTGDVIVGEVSRVNDDNTDNFFLEKGERFVRIEEDEPMLHPLCNEYDKVLA